MPVREAIIRTKNAATIGPLPRAREGRNNVALVPPTVNDDARAGFRPGNWWIDFITGTVYFCVDSAPRAAIWKEMAEGSASHAAFIGLQDNADATIDPDVDDRIQITDDGIINADASGNTLALSIDEAQISHDNIGGVSANDHHSQSHVLASISALGPDHTVAGLVAGYVLKALSATTAAFGQLLHSQLGSVTANQHHNQSHTLANTAGLGADHTTSGLTAGQVLRATAPTTAAFQAIQAGDLPTHTHSHDTDLTDISADDHHAQQHVLASTSALGPDHTVAGLVAGYVLKALSATTAAFGQLLHSQLGSIGADDHHNQSHVLATSAGLGPDHTTSGLTVGHVLKATAAAAAGFGQLLHSQLGSVTANQHHNQSHVLATTSALGPDHTVSGLTIGYVLKAISATGAAFGQLLHSQLGSIGADDHHNAFIGLEDNAAAVITPAADDRIQVTDDSVVNADKSGNTLALSLDIAGQTEDSTLSEDDWVLIELNGGGFRKIKVKDLLATTLTWSTFIPVLKQGTITFTINISDASWKKIGGIVVVHVDVNITSGTGDSSSAVLLEFPAGVPIFAALPTPVGFGQIFDAGGTPVGNPVICQSDQSGSTYRVRFFSAGNNGNAFGVDPNTQLSTNDVVEFTLVYEEGS